MIEYFTGLDLGQTSDYTALAVLEKHTPDDPEEKQEQDLTNLMGPSEVISINPYKQQEKVNTKAAQNRVRKQQTIYIVQHLYRFPLNTPYPKMVGDTIKLFDKEFMRDTHLVIDQTGVGRPVVDMFRQGTPFTIDEKIIIKKPQAHISPITITSGRTATIHKDGWHVSKTELIAVLKSLFASDRLKIVGSLEYAQVLVGELEKFAYKITKAANTTYEAWREQDHDDMVLAVALAAWLGERGRKKLWVA